MDNAKLILPMSWHPDRDEFFEALRIRPNGLGSQLFGKVFDCLFVHSLDLKREYERYYSVEYRTLSEYIDVRYGEIISNDDLEAQHIFLVTWLPQIMDADYDDNKLDAVFECLAQLEDTHLENQT
ncbi:hypothetical protein A9Q96_08355 [Rhodobacterales bacterium 52_120_T64]|nr:hypothetical protein A9Q96_08355 [Rhodobacterales bacterium 52_120_T64]